MDEIEQSGQKITDWQKVKLLGAIQAAVDGLFDSSATELSQVFATDIAPEWRPPEPVHQLRLLALRVELDRLKVLPVQERPIFYRRR